MAPLKPLRKIRPTRHKQETSRSLHRPESNHPASVSAPVGRAGINTVVPMARKDSIEARTLEIGTDIFTKMKGQTPSIFNKAWWNGRMMEWCMKDDAFKVEMFRFVDVLPTLRTPEAIARHLKEYFCRPEQDFPAALQWGLKAVSPTSRIAKMAANTINKKNTKHCQHIRKIKKSKHQEKHKHGVEPYVLLITPKQII